MTQISLLTANGYGTLSYLERRHFDFLPQGAFDSFKHEHLPRTKYDTIVDESSNKPGEQAFEVDPPARVIRCLLTPNFRNLSLEDIWERSCDSSSVI